MLLLLSLFRAMVNIFLECEEGAIKQFLTPSATPRISRSWKVALHAYDPKLIYNYSLLHRGLALSNTK